MMKIRIVGVPPGEAPENVRAAWIGVTLPAIGEAKSPVETVGVLTKPKSRLGLWGARLLGRTRRERGYVVDANVAVEILAAHAPDAVQWWRQHAPRAVAPGELFVFASGVCERVE